MNDADIEYRAERANYIAIEANRTAIAARNTVDILDERIDGLESMIRERFAEQEENLKLFFNQKVAAYAEDICIGLNKAFREHFENGDFEVSEDEFNAIIQSAIGLPF